MSEGRRSTLRAVLAVIAGALVLTATASMAAADPGGVRVTPMVVAFGPTFVYDEQVTGAKTAVLALSTRAGRTTVAFIVVGLPESTWGKTLGAHAHVNSCAADPAAAGGHYANPAATPDTPLHSKEIWLDVTVRQGGSALSVTTVDWLIRPGDANSVVLHAMPTNHDTGAAGARVLCTTVGFGAARRGASGVVAHHQD
jgi:Cu-Zn family superoxide dismutase